jgi:hypothetical protein
MDMFPFLFAIIMIPPLLLIAVNEPLFAMILQGDDIIDANFCPVSIGLGVTSGVTILSVIYIFIQGRKTLKNKKNDEEEVK